MTDKEILDKLEKKFSDDFVYYDRVCATAYGNDAWSKRTYARESLDLIKYLKINSLDREIKIHCFDTSASEGFPCNTYVSNDFDKIIQCLKDLLLNNKSGISRIIIEDNKYGDSKCYPKFEFSSPMEL